MFWIRVSKSGNRIQTHGRTSKYLFSLEGIEKIRESTHQSSSPIGKITCHPVLCHINDCLWSVLYCIFCIMYLIIFIICGRCFKYQNIDIQAVSQFEIAGELVENNVVYGHDQNKQ